MGEIVGIMNTPWGRGARVILGVALIGIGLGALGGSAGGIVLAVVGLVPIAMGLWGRCLLEALAPRGVTVTRR
jgi:hypothetical protein